MSEAEFSGVSWLHDKLKSILSDRKESLASGIANGVPLEEYRQMVGRYRETDRMLGTTLPELFHEFYQSEDDDLEVLDE